MFNDNSMEAVILDTRLDNPYISVLEMYNNEVRFERIDADIESSLKDKDENENEDSSEEDNKNNESLEKLFRDMTGVENLKVKAESLKSNQVSGIIQISEQARRMSEMSSIYGMSFGDMPIEQTLILNKNNDVVKLLLSIKDDDGRKDDIELVCKQIYDLASMSNKPLDMKEMTNFIERSNKILELALKNAE